MGRSLLILVAGALVVGTISMGSVLRNTFEQDAKVSSHEADIVARENAISALNQVVPFVAARFDSLVGGQAVSLVPLTGRAPETSASGETKINCSNSRYTNERSGRVNGTSQALCDRFRGILNVLLAPRGGLRLSGTTPGTLLPTQHLPTGGYADATIRAVNGDLEITATGTYFASAPGQAPEARTFTVRRLYGKVSPFDAALVAVAPYATPTFSGAFQIDGRDTRPGSLTVTGNTRLYRPGIKTTTRDLAGRFAAALGSSNKARVLGRGGEGHIAFGAVQPNLEAIVEEALLHTGKVSLSETVGSQTVGAPDRPAVAVRNGHLTITGTLSGTGLLVVNGNLTTSGAGKLVWDGVVMVRKDDDYTAGTSTAGPRYTPTDMVLTLGTGSVVTGSLVVFQRSSALLVPFDAKLKFRYLGSRDVGLNSSVNIESAYAGQIQRTQLVEPGGNREGHVESTYSANLRAGEQVNFFIGVHYPTWYSNRRLAGTEAYQNYARGHLDPASGKPYGVSTQVGPYKWQMAFEDMRADYDIGFGSRPDWDYYDYRVADQVIEVELQCRSRTADGALKTVLGVQQYEPCTSGNPDTQMAEQTLHWDTVSGTSGQVASPQAGTNLRLTLNGAKIYHSAATIARLTPLLRTIREQAQLVLLDSWTSM